MMKEGYWFLRSDSDPRWNISGEGQVGMFMMLRDCPDALRKLREKEDELNEATPDDLEFGYHKY